MAKKPPQPPANDEALSEYAPTPIIVETQFVKDLSFENPNAPAIFAKSSQPPQISVNVDVKAHTMKDSRYEVELFLRAKALHGEDVAFFIDLIYSGIFKIKGDDSEMKLSPILLVECPRLLFPFARRIIADVSRDAGFPRLLMQPIDFAEMYRRAAEMGETSEE